MREFRRRKKNDRLPDTHTTEGRAGQEGGGERGMDAGKEGQRDDS